MISGMMNPGDGGERSEANVTVKELMPNVEVNRIEEAVDQVRWRWKVNKR